MEGLQLAERYQLTSVLGRGGMGDVWLGCDQRLQRDVAVKILRPQLAADERVRRRFEDEARASAQLAHPHVVAVFDSGEDGGTPFLVMERLSGRTLADEIRHGPLPVGRVQALAEQILSALAAAHGAGVLHRDIKPGNVLLSADGSAKVADFGIAKIVDDLDATTTGVVLGTPAYLAPERIAGHAATPSSDIFAVGVVLYEALTGTCPFEGDHPIAMATAIQQGDFVPVRERRPEVPVAFARVVERAMAKDARDRFSSAATMLAALQSSSAAQVARGPAPTIVVNETMALPAQLAPDARDAPPESEASGGAARPRSYRRAIAWIATLGVLLLAGGSLLLASRNASAPPAGANGGNPPAAGTGATQQPQQPGASQPSTPATTTGPQVSLPPSLDSALSELDKAVRP